MSEDTSASERAEVLKQLGPRWASMCTTHESTTFLWSHNGKTKSGWVQLLPNKKLSTTWCIGTWETLLGNADVVDMSFGTTRHLCHYKDGGFVVEQKYNMKTGKESYKPGKPKACGFITKNDQRGHRGVPGERGYKALGAKRKDMSDDEVEARACSFLQKELKFEAFFTAWLDWKSKRARCMAAVPWAEPAPDAAAGRAAVPVADGEGDTLPDFTEAAEQALPEESAAEAALRAAEAALEAAELAAEAATEAAAEVQ